MAVGKDRKAFCVQSQWHEAGRPTKVRTVPVSASAARASRKVAGYRRQNQFVSRGPDGEYGEVEQRQELKWLRHCCARQTKRAHPIHKRNSVSASIAIPSTMDHV